VHIGLDYIILLNIGTFIACLIMLLIPSFIITKISPVKAIRFE
ncbi:MAG TPA: ABC transporter permease, partial [Flavobacteriaceae bacterium]